MLDPELRPISRGLCPRRDRAPSATIARILFWDLYNEPGNRMDFDKRAFSQFDADLEKHALSLMEAQLRLGTRRSAPKQPLTVAAWTTPLPDSDAHPYQTEIDRSALLHSDIITFHAYWNRKRVAQFIDYLEVLDRPILCTEWMARASRQPDLRPA